MAMREEDVRRLVREELAASTRSDSSRSSAARVTRALIQGASDSVQRSLGAASNNMGSSNNLRPVPGHSNRLVPPRKRGKFPTPPVKPRTFNVVLLTLDLEDRTSYKPEPEDTLLEGILEILPSYTELQIRHELVEVFRQKFSEISAFDFQYLRRERNLVSVPAAGPTFKWGFDAVKALAGQGKLYCRLVIAPADILRRGGQTDLLQDLSENSEVVDVTTPTKENVSYHVKTPSEEISELKQLVTDILEQKCPPSQSLNDAEPGPSTATDDGASSKNNVTDVPMNLPELLKDLHTRLGDEYKRIRTTREDAFVDCLAYYKDACFDATVQLKISYRSEPAIDTGGVLKQFYSQVFSDMLSGMELPALFEGNEGHKLPVYCPDFAISGLPEIAGKIMAHAVCQVGVGPGFLSPCIYHYLCNGKFEDALGLVTSQDVTSRCSYVLNLISSALTSAEKEEALGKVQNDPEYQDLCSECGVRAQLTGDTADSIMQSLMIHNALGKRKVVLDQIRKGLEILDFLTTLSKHQKIMENLFLHHRLQTDEVLNCLNLTNLNDATSLLITEYIRCLDAIQLEKFMVFVTGSKFIPSDLIKIVDGDESCMGIFASTCSSELRLPTNITDHVEFKAAMDAMLNGSKKSFTSF